jgi:hypothetical protein
LAYSDTPGHITYDGGNGGLCVTENHFLISYNFGIPPFPYIKGSEIQVYERGTGILLNEVRSLNETNLMGPPIWIEPEQRYVYVRSDVNYSSNARLCSVDPYGSGEEIEIVLSDYTSASLTNVVRFGQTFGGEQIWCIVEDGTSETYEILKIDSDLDVSTIDVESIVAPIGDDGFSSGGSYGRGLIFSGGPGVDPPGSGLIIGTDTYADAYTGERSNWPRFTHSGGSFSVYSTTSRLDGWEDESGLIQVGPGSGGSGFQALRSGVRSDGLGWMYVANTNAEGVSTRAIATIGIKDGWESTLVPALRQLQRNDAFSTARVRNTGNAPSSIQYSIRRGMSNTYV